ncbi:hypothetical protein, partial [Methylomonas methanica]|uniref:hypothetical protein n=1 Tax=Methylomonas methanica TaxID=421 RepID=UPI001E451593
STGINSIQIIKACNGINFSDWLGQKWLNSIPEASPIKTHFGSEEGWNSSVCSILDNNKIWPNSIWRFNDRSELKISIGGVDGDFFNLKVNPISVEIDPNLSCLLELPQARNGNG